jgi:hypothetical protein
LSGKKRDGNNLFQLYLIPKLLHRTDVRWDSVERTIGYYNFSNVLPFLSPLLANDLIPLLIIDGSNALYGPTGSPYSQMRNDSTRAAFVRYAIATMEHFQGHGIVWELENEPDQAACQLDPTKHECEWYALLAQEVVAAKVQSPARNEILVGPASASLAGGAAGAIDFPFLKFLVKRGALRGFDAVSVHCYSADEPESRLQPYGTLRSLLDSADVTKGMPILSGEWGYSTCRRKNQVGRW